MEVRFSERYKRLAYGKKRTRPAPKDGEWTTAPSPEDYMLYLCLRLMRLFRQIYKTDLSVCYTNVDDLPLTSGDGIKTAVIDLSAPYVIPDEARLVFAIGDKTPPRLEGMRVRISHPSCVWPSRGVHLLERR